MLADEELANLLATAEGLLGDAHFPHRVDVDLSGVLDYARRIELIPGAAPALPAYLEARAAGIGGAYARASALASKALPDLDSARGDMLRVLTAFWAVMQYSQGDGLMHYDEDLQIALPGGPLLGHADHSTGDVYSLIEQTDALLNLGTFSAMLAMTRDEMPFFAPVAQQTLDQLNRAFCGGGDPCAESALLGIKLIARLNGTDAGHDLAAAVAGSFAENTAPALSALAWLRAGDVVLDPVGSPFDLGLRPLNTVNSTMAINTGRAIAEFLPATDDALSRARAAYEQAAAAVSTGHSARISAHLDFREGLLAWRGGDVAGALPQFRLAVEGFRAAADHQRAYQAGIAASIAAALSGDEQSLPENSPTVDYGLRLGSIRLLSKAAAYARYAMADLTGAYQLRELAIASARELEATQILSALLADQASFLTALGQQRSGLIRLQEAIDLHQVFLDAIPGVALYKTRDQQAEAAATVRLVIYSQVLDMVKTALSLEDLLLAETWNKRLGTLEAEGVQTILGPLAGQNEVLIAMHDGDFELGRELAAKHGDPIQAALALLLLDRTDEAIALIVPEIEESIAALETLVDTQTPMEALSLQREKARLEQGLSMLIRADDYALLAEHAARADSVLGEGRIFDNPAKPYERDHFLAQKAAGLGDHQEALIHYRRAMEHLKESADQIGASHSAARFDAETAYLVNDYIQYLFAEHSAESGLEELERFRARDFQQALIASAQLAGSDREFLTRWQRDDAALELAVRAAAVGDAAAKATVATLRRTANASRAALLAALGPSSVAELDLDEVREALAVDEATLLVYHLHGKQSSVVVLRAGKDPVVRRLILPGFELKRLVSRMDADMDYFEEGWRETARTLYTHLLEPVEDLLPVDGVEEKPLLGVVAFGDGHRVPFEALIKDGVSLISRYDFFYAPSLLSYARNATGTHAVATTSVRAIGFNGAQLKQAEAEALMLDAAAAVGENATGARFLELVAGNNPVHVAAHAAPGIDNPYFALIQLAGEDLYLHQLRGRTMSAPLLLLSACDTALAERLRSDQATTFATTLLENGVGAVIVTRWKIDDELTVPLMLDFYAELQAGRTPARALGAAQRAAVAEGGERAHPSFWAAFQVIGSP